MYITESDKNSIVVLKDGSYAKIVSVIKELGGVSLVMGKVKNETFLFWNDYGQNEHSEKDIERVLKVNE